MTLFTRETDVTPLSGLVLPTGQIMDEGLFKLTSADPQVSEQNGASFTTGAFITATGAAADQSNLDKVTGVVPLGAADIFALEGLLVCGVVYDSDIAVDIVAGFGNLQGATLGLTAFEVTAVSSDPNGQLPLITVRLVSASDVQTVCGGVGSN